jgi:hypothetical protein
MQTELEATSLPSRPLAQFPLRLRREPARIRPPAAWFIPGDSAEAWLEEMTGWNVPLAQARLYVVPASMSDRTPCGLLVVPGRDHPQRPRQAIAYAAIGDRLYLPADARLDPEVAADELRSALPHEVQVLHPTAGLVGFGLNDALEVHRLLIAPAPSAADWMHADPGLPPLPRLTAVRAEPAPGIEEMLKSAGDDIGSESPDEAPRSPNESPLADAAGNAARAAIGPVVAGVGWLMSQLGRLVSGGPKPPPPGKANGPDNAKPPAGAERPGPIGRAVRRLAAISKALQARRHRELDRLLNLLQRDPDAGLRFAIPLRDASSRGVAPPSDRLGTHDVDFRWKIVFGGNRPADSWDVPADLQRKLREQYMAAANREARLGRHRRAAYIYCHLLGEFSLGAASLVEGRHFHEAALLYRDKLNNVRAAADCLANGGLLSDAIPLYVELGLDETAGDLHARLEQHDEARVCYRGAMQRLIQSGDILNAARLLETRLNEPDEALDVLAGTWPRQDASGSYLREWFALAGRVGRHEAGLERIRTTRGELANPSPSFTREPVTAVAIFSWVAGTYPADGVRAAAADATRVLAGPRLKDHDSPDRATIVKAVVALAPDDKLLARDGQRFLEQKPPAKPGPKPIPLKPKPGKPLRTFLLPLGKTYHAVATLGGRGFLALGTAGDQCSVTRAKFDGWMQTASAPLPVRGEPRFLLLPPGANGEAILACMSPGGPHSLGRFTVSRVHTFDDEIVLDMPPFSQRTWSACHEETQNLWVLQHSAQAGLVLQCLTAAASGKTILEGSERSVGIAATQLATRYVTLPPEETPLEQPVPMVARSGHVYVALGPTLVISLPGGGQRHIEMPHRIRSLVASPPFTVVRVIATLDEGAAVVMQDGSTRALEGMATPLATFTRDGLLVAVDTHGAGRTYRLHPGGYARQGSFQTLRDPLAVIPATGSEFAVIGTDGKVEIWEPGSI